MEKPKTVQPPALVGVEDQKQAMVELALDSLDALHTELDELADVTAATRHAAVMRNLGSFTLC